jgi:2-amino-4-hydroxy-6-hydroxymethyldihydropteridine diphosphokinase
MKRVYLSLGSNAGDRRQNLSSALARLAGPRLRVTQVSSLYETEPQNVRNQPWFYNIVVECETSLLPRMLLRHLKRIERLMGRRRNIDKGPRTIDLDIVLYGSFIVESPELVIPHASMHERRFVLEPLAELAPDLRHPVFKRSVREMLAALHGQAAKRLPDPIC